VDVSTRTVRSPPRRLNTLLGGRFYTHSSVTAAPAEYIFTETGANDPDFNLRREQSLIQRVGETDRHTFVSLLEPHGEYNGTREFTVASASNVGSIEHHSQDGLECVRISTREGEAAIVTLSFDTDPGAEHRMGCGGRQYEWNGFYGIFEH
jgi:hypothetical protein